MNHPPNYFLADLPAEAAITPAMLTEACQTLKRNRAQYLAGRATESLIRVLDEVARQWRNPGFHFRRMALDEGPARLHFSRETLTCGLDAFFARITGESLEALLAADLGHRNRLDDLVATTNEQRLGRAAIARGPELITHIAAGNIPNPALLNIVFGLLTRSAQFVKCASGASLLPRLFAHSVYEVEPKLGACLEVAEWRGGNTALEAAVFEESDCVTATGSDETLAAVRGRLRPQTRFLGYGHRVSFGYVTREALAGFGVSRIVEAAAADVAAWNQLGCLSPHLFFVETGGRVSPGEFAGMLAGALEKKEVSEPRGDVPADVAAAIATRRNFYEVRAARGTGVQVWRSENSTAWTVVHEDEPSFPVSCLHRFVHVTGVSTLTEALRIPDHLHGRISTVGVAAEQDQLRGIALTLARCGVTRVCPIGEMQNPPLDWRHDGRPALGDLVTWTDFEM
jgi:hypothetical protein